MPILLCVNLYAPVTFGAIFLAFLACALFKVVSILLEKRKEKQKRKKMGKKKKKKSLELSFSDLTEISWRKIIIFAVFFGVYSSMSLTFRATMALWTGNPRSWSGALSKAYYERETSEYWKGMKDSAGQVFLFLYRFL